MERHRVVLTYEDYAALPDDGQRYELHEGELSVTPAPGTRHQGTIGNLYLLLRPYVDARSLGSVWLSPVDVILSAATVVQPDLVYVATDRASLVSERAIEGPPSLVVEVVSPSTLAIDRKTKLELYARHRIPFYWIVDPATRTIEAWELVGAAYRLATRAPGDTAVSLPPFRDLVFTPESLWR